MRWVARVLAVVWVCVLVAFAPSTAWAAPVPAAVSACSVPDGSFDSAGTTYFYHCIGSVDSEFYISVVDPAPAGQYIAGVADVPSFNWAVFGTFTPGEAGPASTGTNVFYVWTAAAGAGDAVGSLVDGPVPVPVVGSGLAHDGSEADPLVVSMPVPWLAALLGVGSLLVFLSAAQLVSGWGGN